MATLIVGAMVVTWLVLARRHSSYLHALFATAPWMGLYVVLKWQIDPFKAGLLLAPMMLIRVRGALLNRRLVFCTFGLGIIAALHLLFQLGSHEIAAYDVVQSLGANERLTVALSMFVLRLILFLYVLAAIRSLEHAESCLRWYCGSMFVLACYGLVQELVYLSTGSPITPIYRAGILGSFNEYQALDIGSVTLLRVHSFCGEPKDLALFAAPAIAYLGYQALLKRGARPRATSVIQLVTIITASLLTLSSSFLLVLPVLIIGAIILSGRRLGRLRIVLAVTAFALMLAPVWVQLSGARVFDRFAKADDLLQPSREQPALDFWIEHMPRSLLGFGVGSQAYYVPSKMPNDFLIGAMQLGHSVGVDSFWLSMLLDLGIPGIAITLIISCSVIFGKQIKTPRLAALRGAALAVVLICIPLQGDFRGAVFWLMAGAASGGALGLGATTASIRLQYSRLRRMSEARRELARA